MNNPPKPQTPREFAQAKMNTARANLLLMLIFTVVNIVLLLLNSDTMLLFSATIPYYAAIIARIDGWLPVVLFYGGIALISLLLYFFCWLFSKRHYGWMIAALVLFGIDTLAMVTMYISFGDVSGVLDAVIHVWVLYYLIIGVKYGRQLKTLPVEMSVNEAAQAYAAFAAGENSEEAEANTQTPAHSTPLRRVEEDEKHRVLLEHEVFGHHICYRRVKRTNELVIDQYVYDEVTMLMETAHELRAVIDGCTIEVGFDGVAHSFVRVNGEKVASKLRLF